jgi:hypothetical protein
VALTGDQFNSAVVAFIDDVAHAVDCFPAPWNVDGELVHPDDGERLRAVVDAKVDLRDTSDNGLAELGANYKLCVDSYGQHLAVEHSSFVLKAKVDRTPIIRWDYDREARSKPNSHVQITAHRGALSHLLSRLDHKTPHSIESLHVPMGGERFRPCLEDIVEFLIRDCGFRGKDGWNAVVRDGRAKWRRIQIRAVVRDSPAEAVAALIAMGYSVAPPEAGEPDERVDKLTAW